MRSPALCGRTQEQAVVVAAVDRLPRGGGCALALMGPAGVGKSRLARELLRHAPGQDVPVFAGRAVPGPAPVAYRPLTEALLTWTRQAALPDTATLGPYRRALEHLVVGDGSDDAGPLSPVFVGEAVLRLLGVVGDGRGATLAGIAQDLERDGVRNGQGGEHWHPSTVRAVPHRRPSRQLVRGVRDAQPDPHPPCVDGHRDLRAGVHDGVCHQLRHDDGGVIDQVVATQP